MMDGRIFPGVPAQRAGLDEAAHRASIDDGSCVPMQHHIDMPTARKHGRDGRARRVVERRRQAAFTLIELLAVLAISAILLSVALPAVGEMLRAYRLKLAARDLLGAVELARGQAIASGQKVLLAPSSDSLSWSDGWTVFIDRNGNRRPDAGDLIIGRHPAIDPGIAISMHFGGQQGSPYLAYNSMGRGCNHNNSLAPRFGTLTVAQGGLQRRIKINMLGRARLCDPGRDGANCAGNE
jgi:type IV fimbrial biogenesis protein FimT